MRHAHVPTFAGGFRQWRVAVLEAHAPSHGRLLSAVAEAGVEAAVVAIPRPDIMPLICQTRCDAVLLGLEAADQVTLHLTTEAGRPVVVCSENTGADMVDAARRAGVMAFLVKPIRPEQLVPTLSLAIVRFRDQQALRRTLEERKIIERAKGRVMLLHGATEEDAFRWLRRRAMDTRSRLVDVARDVLVAPVASRGASA